MKRGGKIKQGEYGRLEMKEKGKLLMSVVEEFKKTNPSETVTGFNSTKFDPHSLSTRLHVLGKMNSEVWNILHNRNGSTFTSFLEMISKA